MSRTTGRLHSALHFVIEGKSFLTIPKDHKVTVKRLQLSADTKRGFAVVEYGKFEFVAELLVADQLVSVNKHPAWPNWYRATRASIVAVDGPIAKLKLSPPAVSGLRVLTTTPAQAACDQLSVVATPHAKPASEPDDSPTSPATNVMVVERQDDAMLSLRPPMSGPVWMRSGITRPLLDRPGGKPFATLRRAGQPSYDDIEAVAERGTFVKLVIHGESSAVVGWTRRAHLIEAKSTYGMIRYPEFWTWGQLGRAQLPLPHSRANRRQHGSGRETGGHVACEHQRWWQDAQRRRHRNHRVRLSWQRL